MRHGTVVLVVVLAALAGCTPPDVEPEPTLATSTPPGDTALSEVLCDVLEPDAVVEQLSAVADRPVNGPLETILQPSQGEPDGAQVVASCALATQSRESFDITGCTTGVSRFNAFVLDFTFGPNVDRYESDAGSVEVRGATAAEFQQQSYAASPILGGQPWEPVPGGAFIPDLLTVQRVVEPNNQLLYVHVGGLDRDAAPGGCVAVRDLLIEVSDRIIAAADRLRPS
jgi:hypothetical protein